MIATRSAISPTGAATQDIVFAEVLQAGVMPLVYQYQRFVCLETGAQLLMWDT